MPSLLMLQMQEREKIRGRANEVSWSRRECLTLLWMISIAGASRDSMRGSTWDTNVRDEAKEYCN